MRQTIPRQFAGNQSRSTNQKIRNNIVEEHYNQPNLEQIKDCVILTSIINKEINNRQTYTNQLFEKIQRLPESYLSLAEASNVVVNQGFVAISNNFINLIESKYCLQNFGEIFKYLYENQKLIPTILEAEKQIRKFFIDEKLVLKMVYDPEIINWKKLMISIHTQLDVDEAFSRLKLFDNSWWLDASYIVGNDLDIHINFDEI